MACTSCGSGATAEIYQATGSPLFQNKVYPTQILAEQSETGDLILDYCGTCGLVSNRVFDASLMEYDENYQNEQANSETFIAHLADMMSIIQAQGFLGKKIVEIGCGKGYFLKELWDNGFDAIGFDPSYEGSDERIVKDYFSDKYPNVKADLIVLRHTLEHIQAPYRFLQTIAQSAPDAYIFIEVPDFNWIVNNSAFWDIFYEHCNYFTPEYFSGIFETIVQGGCFSDQYQYVLAPLSSLISPTGKRKNSTLELDVLARTKSLWQNYVEKHAGMAIWGAGAKGSTFANLIDPQRKYINYVVDINPRKQGRRLAKSAHEIVSPEALFAGDVDHVLVMNPNYVLEVERLLAGRNITIEALGVENDGNR